MNDLAKNRVDEITKLHSEIAGYIKVTLSKAIRIGELLTEQKDELAHGEWLPWVEDNLPFSERTARRYMTAWHRRDELKTDRVTDLTQAYKLLEQPAMARREKTPEEIAGQRLRIKEAQEKFKKSIEQEKEPTQSRPRRSVEELLKEADRAINIGAAVNGALRLDGKVENLAQENVFAMIDQYIYAFPTTSRRLEAAHNLIKRVKETAVDLQKQSAYQNV